LIRDADFAIEGLDAKPEPDAAVPDDPPESIKDDKEIRNLAELARKFSLAINAAKTRFGAHDAMTRFAVQTLHRIPGSEDTVTFSLETDESSGTQRFFAVIGPVLEALDEGRLLVVDELDCSMHPQLTYKLVEMFHSPEANPRGAQLVFATHDTSLMTPALFRRDQIWLTEKTRKGAAVLFSLCEIEPEKRPRKDEPFEKHYLAGRYGGVPNFGPALEDFERL
jgi:AAA15 family ATPase/GTPase